MNINQIRKCYDLCDSLEKEGLERCFIDAIRGTLSVKQTLWDKNNPKSVLRSFGSMSCDVFDDKRRLMTHVVRDFKVDPDEYFEPIIRPLVEMTQYANAMFFQLELSVRESSNHPHFIALNFV